MAVQAGFWDIENSLEALSAEGDPLEKRDRAVPFEKFRPLLLKVVRRSNPPRGGRPGFDVVLKFRMPVLQSLYGPSLQQTAFQADMAAVCGLRPGDFHRKKPKGKPMLRATARANAVKSSVRVSVEHALVEQKSCMRLFIRTIGRARGEAAILLVNMAYNMKRWCWLERRASP